MAPVHDLAADGKATELEQLIGRTPGDVYFPNRYGWTPLMKAAQKDHADVMEVLRKAGADVNTKSSTRVKGRQHSSSQLSKTAPAQPGCCLHGVPVR